MADQRKTGIAWTEHTWNPIRGCSRVSEGCRNCYAETQAARFAGPGQPYEGLIQITSGGPRWNGVVKVVEGHLADPLRWKRPRLIFVNSMSDLFHEGLGNEQIAAVFGVMAAAPQHTFQVLTKRARRMREWFAWLERERAERLAHAPPRGDGAAWELCLSGLCVQYARMHRDARFPESMRGYSQPWPLPNVWLGVSVEDQESADVRIPDLLETPAAVRWVSYEPAIGPVDWVRPWCERHGAEHVRFEPPAQPWCIECDSEASTAPWLDGTVSDARNPRIDWIVVGGESGPGARPFNIAWARSTIEACKSAEVACFVKQLGAGAGADKAYGCDGRIWWDPRATTAVCVGAPFLVRDRKGGDPTEWPEDLRVREWPNQSVDKEATHA